MVDSQSCSDGNRTGLDGTDDEKERESMSFGVRQPKGNVIWISVTSLIFNTVQMEALLDWETATPLAAGFSPSPIAASPPKPWSLSAPETSMLFTLP